MLEARDVAIETFEQNVYCTMKIGTFDLSCRMQRDGTAVCSMWKQLSDGPSKPPRSYRSQAERVAEALFARARLSEVA